MRDPERLSSARRSLLRWYAEGLRAVHGRARVRAALLPFPLPDSVYVLAVGKAAVAMAQGAHDVIGARLAAGLVVTAPGLEAGSPLPVVLGGHPLPDAGSLAAGRAVRDFCQALPEGAYVLVLLSGGASAMLEWPIEGVELEQVSRANAWMLAAGLPIASMNAVRARLSRLKAGGLRRLLGSRPVLQLLISDVPGDDPAVIGSGPLIPAMASLPAGLPDWLLPNAALPAPDTSTPTGPTQTRIVANNADLRDAVAAQARAEGVPVYPAQELEGDAWSAGERCAQTVLNGQPGLYLWGGETTVVLPDAPGRGGRNQHLALAAASVLAGHDRIVLLAAGSDGIDGNTEDAGALVDGLTLTRAEHEGIHWQDARRRADSGTLLDAAGDLLNTGPTGTNVMDVVMGLRLA